MTNEEVELKAKKYDEFMKKTQGYGKKWRDNNKEYLAEKSLSYYHRRKQIDPEFVETIRARSREFYWTKLNKKKALEIEVLTILV